MRTEAEVVMKGKAGWRFLMALLVGLGATLVVDSAEAARLKVVATTADLGALVTEVGGDLVEVTVLASPSEDPHYVDPRPSFLVALSRADALILNGLELEIGWLPPLLVNARNPAIQLGATGYIDASAMLSKRLGVPAGKVDRAMGDIHPGGNPHFTSSPAALAEVAPRLSERLAQLLPAERAALVSRGASVRERLSKLGEEWRVRMRALGSRKVIVYHESYVYLSDWLGLETVAAIENKPGIKPSPAHIAQVLKTMRATGARVILQEEWHADASSKTLARLADGEVVALPGGVGKGQTLEAHLAGLARRIHDALGR
jgi:zinc/manganese transport system substrate-binding protein